MGLEFFKKNKPDANSMIREARADVNTDSLRTALAQILGEKSAPLALKPEHVTKGQEVAAQVKEGLGFVKGILGRQNSETTALDLKDQAEKGIDAHKSALQTKREAQAAQLKTEQKLMKIMGKMTSPNGSVSAEDLKFYAEHKNDVQVTRAELVAATDPLVEDLTKISEAEEALAKVRGNLPKESLKKEQDLSDEFEKTQAEQFAEAQAILEVVSSANGEVLTKAQLDLAIAHARRFSLSERGALQKLTSLADRLKVRYPDEWAKDGKSSQDYARETGAKKLEVMGQRAWKDQDAALKTREVAELMSRISVPGLDPEFVGKLGKELGITITGEGDAKTGEFVPGSIGQELADWKLYAETLALEAARAKEMATSDNRVADSLVIIEATRYRVDLRIKMLNERVKTLIDKALVDQKIDLQKKAAVAAENVEKQNRLMAKQAEAEALAKKIFDWRKNAAKDIYTVPEKAFGGLKKLFGRMEAHFGKTKETQIAKVQSREDVARGENTAEQARLQAEANRVIAESQAAAQRAAEFFRLNPELAPKVAAPALEAPKV